MQKFFTPGPLAVKLGVQPHHITNLCKRKLIPFALAGNQRLIAAEDVDQVRAALLRPATCALSRRRHMPVEMARQLRRALSRASHRRPLPTPSRNCSLTWRRKRPVRGLLSGCTDSRPAAPVARCNCSPATGPAT